MATLRIYENTFPEQTVRYALSMQRGEETRRLHFSEIYSIMNCKSLSGEGYSTFILQGKKLSFSEINGLGSDDVLEN